MTIPLPLRIGALVLATTAFYTYVGQMVPQSEVQAPQETVLSSDLTTDDMVKVGREITENPAAAVELRTKYNLLPDLGAEAETEITEFYKETAEAGALPLNGGGADAAAADFEFFTSSGQLEGDPASLKVEDFWDTSALDRVLANIGAK